GLLSALGLLLVISLVAKVLGASLKASAAEDTSDDDLEVRKDDVDGALVPLSTASADSAETESSVDQDDVGKQLARTLGVEDGAPRLTAGAPIDADGDEPPIAAPEQTAARAPDADAPMPPERLADAEAASSPERDRAAEATPSAAAAGSEPDAAKLA